MTRPLWRRFASIIAATVLTLSFTQPAAAYNFNGGWFTNDAFYSWSAPQDPALDVCFEANTPVYTNRHTLNQAMRWWANAAVFYIESHGSNCNGDTNIKVEWNDLGYPCETLAKATYSLFGHYITTIELNSRCSWDWGEFTPVNDGYADAFSVIAHEFGHVWGLDHQSPANGGADLMDSNMHFCFPVGRRHGISADDAAGFRARYPGIVDTSFVYPASASCTD